MRRALLCAVAALLCACESSPPPLKGNAANGQAAFRGYCAVCHNADSRDRKVGPGLKGLFHWSATSTGMKPTEANICAKIENGGSGMPPFKDTLSGPEMNDLIAYLETL